jgi:DNA-binding CsgD family transcriptional regulator
MASVFTIDGDVRYMSPVFTRTLMGPEARNGSAAGRNLCDILGEVAGRERIGYLREVAASREPMVVRCVIRGLQHITHFFPAVDVTNPEETLVGAFHEVLEGVIDPAAFQDFNYIEAAWNDYGKLAQLTPRESEIAVRIGLGMDAKQIADALTRSLETVASHKKSLYAKMGCEGQLTASIMIRRCGLTERDVPRIAQVQKM